MIVADGKPKQIKSRTSKLSISFKVNPEISLENLYLHPEIHDISRKNDRVYIQADNTDKVLELITQGKKSVRVRFNLKAVS